jgi:hypothetical protein
VKPPPPAVLRKGALVRVAGGPGDRDVEAFAFAFLDLRFPDGDLPCEEVVVEWNSSPVAL